MTTLVTGAAGFVAAALVEAAAARGERVVAVDRAPPPAALAATWAAQPGPVVVEAADVRRRDDLAAIMRRHAVRTLIHAAAVTAGPAREVSAPADILDVNVVGTLRAIEAMRDASVARAVVLSSASAYGAAAFDGAPVVDEATVCRPETLYSISKFAAESAARRVAVLAGLDVRVVRLTAVFGPWERDTGVRDTLSPPYQAARLALRGEPAILARPGRRDWVYSRDVAAAVLAVRDAPAAVLPAVNIGPGVEWTIADWCERLAARFPGFRWRLAAPGEAPTVDLHGDKDRRPLAVDRLAALGYRSDWPLDRCIADYAAWLERHAALIGA